MAKRNQFRKSVRVKGAAFSALAAALSLGLSSIAKAAPVVTPPITFAQYEEVDSANPNLFSYTESGMTPANGGSAQLNSSVSIPVYFSFESLPGLPASLLGAQLAHLTLTTQTVSAATTLGSLGVESFPTQTLDTLTITRDTAIGGLSNLLTMTFTGNLIGTNNGYTAELTGQTVNGDSINYTSDFITIPNAPRDYSLNFTSWITTATNGGFALDGTSGFVQNATAAGTGSFDGSGVTISPAVPEPMTGTLVVTSLGIFFLRRRNRTV